MAKRNVAQRPMDLSEMADTDFGPMFEREKVESMEQTAQRYGVERRVALAIASISKQDMLQNHQGEDDVAAGTMWLDQFEQMGDFVKHLEAQLEVAKAVQNRCLCMAAHYQRHSSLSGAAQ